MEIIIDFKKGSWIFLASSNLARIMKTTGFVVPEGLFKEAKDAHIRHKNNEKRKKRERAEENCETRRQFKIKKEKLERLERQVIHYRLEKVLDKVDFGNVTDKKRIKDLKHHYIVLHACVMLKNRKK